MYCDLLYLLPINSSIGSIILLNLPPLLPPLPPFSNHWLGFQFRKQSLANLLNSPAPNKVERHCSCKLELELPFTSMVSILEQQRRIDSFSCRTYQVLHFDNLEPSIQFGDKVSRTRHSDRRSSNQAPPERRIFSDSLSERSAL